MADHGVSFHDFEALDDETLATVRRLLTERQSHGREPQPAELGDINDAEGSSTDDEEDRVIPFEMPPPSPEAPAVTQEHLFALRWRSATHVVARPSVRVTRTAQHHIQQPTPQETISGAPGDGPQQPSIESGQARGDVRATAEKRHPVSGSGGPKAKKKKAPAPPLATAAGENAE